MFGETKTGITFHLLNEKFDAGAIVLQKEVDIYKTDNSATLKTRLCKDVSPMCEILIRKLDTEILPTLKQDESLASYYSHVSPSEIVVEPHLMTFDEIHNRIRGLAPHQSTYLLYKDEYFKIYDYNEVPAYVRRSGSNLCLKTKDNKFIYFKNLRALGRIKRYFTSTILNLLHY
jgi:methionyl-tRNA formyltransferase